MADKVPIRGAYDGSNALTGLANFVSSETIGVAHGGTGIATVGSNQLVTGNGTSAMTSESNLTFDGSTLLVSGTASATSVMAADSGAALSSQNAKKIILVDLTDPGTMWDVQAFLARARYTSWYQESGIGAPPMRGAIWIINGQTEIVWWDLDKDVEWMSFEAGTGGIAQSASPVMTDIAFLDGILYVTMTTGMQLVQVDFLRDRATRTSATNNTVFVPFGIANRNGSWGHINYRDGAQYVIANSSVNAVAAVRDPSVVDEFDRPKHWWAVATAGGMSVYNPINDAIYDGSSTDAMLSVGVAPDGTLSYARNYSGDDIATIRSSIYTISADGWTRDYYWYESGSNGAMLPASASVVLNDMRPFLGGPQSRMAALGSDEGLFIFVLNEAASTANIAEESGVIKITSTYQTPYMKGNRFAAFPLNDVNDRSGRGYALTNNNSVTFTSGIFGNVATFDGTDQYLDKTSGITEVSLKSAMFWAKSTSATNPSGSSDYVLRFRKASNGAGLWFAYNTSGQMVMHASTDGSGSAQPTTTPDTHDAKWHHYAFTWASDGNWHSYIDGVEVASTSGANGGCPADTIAIGAAFGSNYFAGQMAMVVGSASELTANEINLEYQRGIRSLGGATHTLANTDVTSVRIDQNSGLAAITTAANQTEIWDITTGLRESIDATTTATINDADVRFKSGAILPEYITGRSGAIEFDGQERNVLG